MVKNDNFSVLDNTELKEYFRENDLRVLEGYDFKEERTIVTIMKEDCDSKLNISMDPDGDNISAEVVSNDSVIEKFVATNEDETTPEEEIKKIVEAYLVICEYDNESDEEKVDDTDNNDDSKELILSEDADDQITGIPESLSAVSDKVKKIGDELKRISGMSSDVDIISIIMDCANNAYTLAIDINESIETWKELMEEKIAENAEEAE